MTTRILSKHFEDLGKRLSSYGVHAGIADHPNLLGAAREGFVQLFLKENLPSVVDFKTGQIIDKNDTLSGQVDIILQSALSPRIHLFGDIEIAFADHVIGAIEVKSTLTTGNWDSSSHLKSALETITKIKSLQREHLISGLPNWMDGQRLTLPNTPCFIFAYDGPEAETLIKKLQEYATVTGLSFDQYIPEVIVVLNRHYYLCKNDGWIFPSDGSDSKLRKYEGSEHLVGLFVYICQLIEEWNSKPHHTVFAKFFGVISQDD